MNNKQRVVITVLSVFCVGLVVFIAYLMNVFPQTKIGSQIRPPSEQTTKPEPTPTPVSKTTSPTTYKDLVEIFSPLPNSIITLTSPQTTVEIKGKARGTWFFEASFPVELVNTLGDTIAKGIAHADGDWMTSEYVPFSSTLTFTASKDQTGDIGELLLKKDNPSGDPARDDEFAVPVQFAP